MTRIHASAVIDSKAELASDVEIGPYSVIGPNVKIGAGTKVGSHTVIEGHTTIGIDNHFAHFAAMDKKRKIHEYPALSLCPPA